jgi:N-acetylglucosaminyl-diphospho-decaprenol L-rhamnosyltransferase
VSAGAAPVSPLGNDAVMEADKLHADPAGAPATQDRSSVDVVIVSADMGEMTLACVAELDDDPVLARVVVVDNAFDAPGEERAALSSRASVVALERPLGFAAANNRGLVAGEAPYVLLLNSDILVVPGAIGTLLAALREAPGAVAAGGRLVDPDTLATQAGYRPRPFPSLANFLVILLGIEELWPGNPVTRRYHGAAVEDAGVQDVAQPAAAALMVRRAALKAVGGFDERFWFWFEDSDLLLRLSSRGRVLYVPQAVFRHLGGGTFARWSKSERIRSAHHGILHYADAHLSRSRRAFLGAVALAISLPRIALFARSRPQEARAWRAVAAGGLALLRGRPVGAIAPGPEAGARAQAS